MTVIDFGNADRGREPAHPSWADPRDTQWQDEQWQDARWQDDDARYATASGPVQGDGIGARIGRLLNYFGAIVSVLLMGGLAVWGWNLVTRDVSAVPVIRALEGDARITPANPGGSATAHAGLSVNEVPAGVAIPPQAEIAIAPAPVGLTPEDVAMGQLGATARAPGALSESAPAEMVDTVLPLADADAARLLAQAQAEAEAAELAAAAIVADSADAALMSDAPARDAPVDLAVTGLDGQPVSDQAQAITAAVAAAAPELAAAPRPARRPSSLSAAVAAPAAATPTAEARVAQAAPAPEAKPAEPVKTASVASGSTVVQIGAFDSDALARGEWSRISGRHGGLFSGKSPVVQKTEKNGRTFWRLRVAGFGTRDEARSFCTSLKSKGTDCIPTAAN